MPVLQNFLEQSVYIAGHQTENNVNSNGISSVCLVNRELAMMSCAHAHREFTRIKDFSFIL